MWDSNSLLLLLQCSHCVRDPLLTRTKAHPDPEGVSLREYVEILDREGALDDDVIFWDWVSLFQNGAEGRTEQETRLFKMALSGMVKAYIYWRVRAIALPRPVPNRAGYLESGWTVFELMLAAFCQHILYSQGKGNEEVEAIMRIGMDPKRLAKPIELIEAATFTGGIRDKHAVSQLFKETFRKFEPAPTDALGFANFCEAGNIAWLLVRYVKAEARRGGPFPRRQELPPGSFIVGAPPRGRRKFVVSHGWEAEVHPSPSGEKMARLASALVTLEAGDDDLVFLDFCSNTQEAKLGRYYQQDEPFAPSPARSATADAYFERNDVAFVRSRSPAEKSSFSFAMWDMGRLYAYEECEVIVLPTLEHDAAKLNASFPGGAVWGMPNTRAYEKRGWCASEFAIARKNNRIKNLNDPDVQRVLASRPWPETNDDYAEMMTYTDSPSPPQGLVYEPSLAVDFTNKGDRDVVKYNFYKMSSLAHDWLQA